MVETEGKAFEILEKFRIWHSEQVEENGLEEDDYQLLLDMLVSELQESF